MILLGLAIAATLTIGLAHNAPQMLDVGHVSDGSSFAGSATQGRAAIILMVWALLTSLAFTAGGVQLMRSGSLQPWLKALAGFFIVTLLALGWRLGAVFG